MKKKEVVDANNYLILHILVNCCEFVKQNYYYKIVVVIITITIAIFQQCFNSKFAIIIVIEFIIIVVIAECNIDLG